MRSETYSDSGGLPEGEGCPLPPLRFVVSIRRNVAFLDSVYTIGSLEGWANALVVRYSGKYTASGHAPRHDPDLWEIVERTNRTGHKSGTFAEHLSVYDGTSLPTDHWEAYDDTGATYRNEASDSSCVGGYFEGSVVFTPSVTAEAETLTLVLRNNDGEVLGNIPVTLPSDKVSN